MNYFIVFSYKEFYFFSYKYIVDGEYLCNDNDLKNNDIYGNINNYLVL